MKIEHINKIANGIRPIFKNLDEQIIYDFAAEVNIKKNVSDEVYDRAYDLLGLNTVIDIVAICGYYNLISMTINVFKVSSEATKWILPEVKNFEKLLP